MGYRAKIAGALAMNIGRSSSAKSMAMGGLLIGAAAHGLSQGIGTQDISGGLYELATGNPDIDQEVFGTSVGMRELMMPLPWDKTQMFGRSGIGRPFGLFGGISSGMINTTTVGDHFKHANRGLASDPTSFGVQPPLIDGSLVFGMSAARRGY